MPEKVLIVGQYAASNSPDDWLKTYALGSCIAVILFDRQTRSIGMLHAALPDSTVSPEKAVTRPGYFVDTGIDRLIQSMAQLGASPTGSGLGAKLVGGGAMLDQANLFDVGKRNVDKARVILASKNIRIVSEDTGKNISRTVAVHIGSAKLTISSPGHPDWSV